MTNNNNNNEENSSIHHHHGEPQWLTKYANQQSDWLEKTKGNLMIVATVIASVSFQVMVTPPGGVWQEDTCSTKDKTVHPPSCHVAGTAVLEHNDQKRISFLVMVISSVISFTASMSVIFLVILGLRLRNRFVMVILVLSMAMSVISLAVAFIMAVLLVNIEDDTIGNIVSYYVIFWIGFPLLIVGVILIRLFVKLLVWVIRRACCGRSTRSSSQLPPIIATTHPVPHHSASGP